MKIGLDDAMQDHPLADACGSNEAPELLVVALDAARGGVEVSKPRVSECLSKLWVCVYQRLDKTAISCWAVSLGAMKLSVGSPDLGCGGSCLVQEMGGAVAHGWGSHGVLRPHEHRELVESGANTGS